MPNHWADAIKTGRRCDGCPPWAFLPRLGPAPQLAGLFHVVPMVFVGFVGDRPIWPMEEGVRFVRKADPRDDAIGKPCPYCGAPMTLVGKRGASRDHLHPKSRGGRFLAGNRLIVCRKCNTAKADRTLGEWLAVLIARGDPRARRVAALAAAHSPVAASIAAALQRDHSSAAD